MASMMDCQKVQPLLSEYVDGTLDGDTAWNVKLHLGSCAVCSRIAEDFTATTRLLGTLERHEPSANFEAMLASRLADIALKPRRATPWDRVRAWWSDQPGGRLRRPALASAVAAFAALIPLAVMVSHNSFTGSGITPPAQVLASPTPSAEGNNSGTLREIWDEHTEYSSSQPLGDQSGLLASLGPDL